MIAIFWNCVSAVNLSQIIQNVSLGLSLSKRFEFINFKTNSDQSVDLQQLAGHAYGSQVGSVKRSSNQKVDAVQESTISYLKRNLSVDSLPVIQERKSSKLSALQNAELFHNSKSRNYGSNTQQRDDSRKERAREIIYKSPYGRSMPESERQEFVGHSLKSHHTKSMATIEPARLHVKDQSRLASTKSPTISHHSSTRSKNHSRSKSSLSQLGMEIKPITAVDYKQKMLDRLSHLEKEEQKFFKKVQKTRLDAENQAKLKEDKIANRLIRFD